MSVKRIAPVFAAVIILAQTSISVPQAATVSELADHARQLMPGELYDLYKNRSWVWTDGGGYFRQSMGGFKSWVGKGDKALIANGVWYLPGKGKLCWKAIWKSSKWLAWDTTCFSHRTDGKNIFQRRLPNGEWYIFKHTPVHANDEFGKLKRGDRISARHERNKLDIEARRLKWYEKRPVETKISSDGMKSIYNPNDGTTTRINKFGAKTITLNRDW